MIRDRVHQQQVILGMFRIRDQCFHSCPPGGGGGGRGEGVKAGYRPTDRFCVYRCILGIVLGERVLLQPNTVQGRLSWRLLLVVAGYGVVTFIRRRRGRKLLVISVEICSKILVRRKAGWCCLKKQRFRFEKFGCTLTFL